MRQPRREKGGAGRPIVIRAGMIIDEAEAIQEKGICLK
jgi:hypothetical protein